MATAAFGVTIKSNRIPAVQSAMRRGTLASLERRVNEAVDVIRAYEHVLTGRMRRETRGTVAVMRNDVATSAIIVDVPYAQAEEFGTVYRPGHYRVTAGAAAFRRPYEDRTGNAIGTAIMGAAL